MPIEVRRAVGYALFAAQQGDKHADAKVLKRFGDAGVLEVVARHDGEPPWDRADIHPLRQTH